MILIYAFLVDHIPFKLLLLSTITTGGDTASHVQSLAFMKDYLLPHGKWVGWSPGNYGGFPVFIYYFPLVFLIGALLSFVVPMLVAFKIISVLGALLLPLATYIMLRLMRMPYPAPILGAISSLVILFNESHSMWGGNFLSNYAGEFTYAFSFALTFVFLGFIFRAQRDVKHALIGAGLIALIISSHGFTFIICALSSIYFLLKRKTFLNEFVFLGSVFGLGVLLVGAWFFQLYFNSPFVTEYNLIWTFGSLLEIFPKMLWPFQILFVMFTGFIVFDRITRKNKIAALWVEYYQYAWFIVLICILAFFSSETLKLPDIRFIPFAHFISVVFGAVSIAWVVGELKSKLAIPFVAFFLMLLWLHQFPSQALGWAKYNYSGIESTPNWETFRKLNDQIKGNYSQPRVVYEHNANQQSMGTPRAFESIPFFSGRATLEGLYFQSSMLSTAVFYLQSLYSKEISCPFPDYPCSSMNYERAHRYLELFNVNEMILYSNAAKTSAALLPSLYRKVSAFSESGYEIWSVVRKHQGYVESLAEDPEFVPWEGIRYRSYEWLREYKSSSRFLISKPNLTVSPYDFRSLQATPATTIKSGSCTVSRERINQESIEFSTDCLGRPHLIKIAYHPGWEVQGAEGPYYASPGMLIVYPRSQDVRLEFKNSRPALIGKIASASALLIIIVLALFFRHRRIHFLSFQKLNRLGYVGFLVGSSVVVFLLLMHLAQPGYQRSFKYAEVFYTAKEYKTAQKMFKDIISKWNSAPTIDKVKYYLALSYLLNNQPKEAADAFRSLYPSVDSEYLAEAHYHVGLIAKNANDCKTAIIEFDYVIDELKNQRWSEYAKERKNECRARH